MENGWEGLHRYGGGMTSRSSGQRSRHWFDSRDRQLEQRSQSQPKSSENDTNERGVVRREVNKCLK